MIPAAEKRRRDLLGGKAAAAAQAANMPVSVTKFRALGARKSTSGVWPGDWEAFEVKESKSTSSLVCSRP